MSLCSITAALYLELGNSKQLRQSSLRPKAERYSLFTCCGGHHRANQGPETGRTTGTVQMEEFILSILTSKRPAYLSVYVDSDHSTDLTGVYHPHQHSFGSLASQHIYNPPPPRPFASPAFVCGRRHPSTFLCPLDDHEEWYTCNTRNQETFS